MAALRWPWTGGTAKSGEWTEVLVSDTGIGIGAQDLSKLFRPFSQVDGSCTRKYNGTGLGLAISRKFCRMMGGDITVRANRAAARASPSGCPLEEPSPATRRVCLRVSGHPSVFFDGPVRQIL